MATTCRGPGKWGILLVASHSHWQLVETGLLCLMDWHRLQPIRRDQRQNTDQSESRLAAREISTYQLRCADTNYHSGALISALTSHSLRPLENKSAPALLRVSAPCTSCSSSWLPGCPANAAALRTIQIRILSHLVPVASIALGCGLDAPTTISLPYQRPRSRFHS